MKKTIFGAVFMAAALALAGCGGGSSSDGEEMTGPTPAEMEKQRARTQTAALSTASTALNTALGGLSDTEPTQGQIDAVNSAIGGLEAALDAAADVGDDVKGGYQDVVDSARTRVGQAEGTLTAMQNKANEAAEKAMAAVGKALYAALAGNATAGTTALNNAAVAFTADGDLTVTAAAGAGSFEDNVTPPVATLEAGDSAGVLGDWAGMDYAHSTGTGDAKVTNEARVYTNQGAPTRVAFFGTGAGQYTALTDAGNEGYIAVDGTAPAEVARVMSASFTHSGMQNHSIPERHDAFYVRGTYDGAPGEYRCSTGPCTSTNDGSGSPSALGGTWHFKPDTGAMVSRPDTEYLYYGWWVSKDSDGPTAASAFAGVVEPADGDLDTGGDLTAITGSASYSGSAAGKFAMSNPLDGTGNGGHFTADANLEATFGTDATAAGVTGTIDNFRLNDGSEDPGWSVALARGALGSSDGTITAPTADPTVWSINGNKAPASGTWSGTMYDEMPGLPPDGDGSNIPTTVTGTFYSEFSSIGRMVGAFGADLDN